MDEYLDEYLKEIDQLLGEDITSVRRRERSAFDESLASAGGRVVLFGAGNLGRRVLQCLRSAGTEPVAFADNNQARWNTAVEGVPILSPQAAAEKFGRSALFLVTIWSLGHSFRQTREQLCRLGCNNIVANTTVRWKFAKELLPDFCQDLPHKLYEQADEVRAAASLWADDYSCREYRNQVGWRAHADLGSLSEPLPNQYFQDDLFHLLEDEVFVDCGAYDGDTSGEFVRLAATFRRIIAIEPDPANYVRLRRWVSTLSHMTMRIASYNLAIGAMKGHAPFRATGVEAACVAADGNVLVERASLDELISNESPTYIKMDIEGAELEALAGGQMLIRRCQPVLAICLYHKFDDLWRIPLFIRGLCPEYAMFLRPHAEDGRELVCYAVPPNRLTAEWKGLGAK